MALWVQSSMHAHAPQVYCENVYDLLAPGRGGGDAEELDSLDIRQDAGAPTVPGAVTVPVRTAADVMGVLWAGARNRAVCATDMNERSSRSHTIFQVVVEQRPAPGAPAGSPILRSKLNLVDLAGSEKWRPHQLASFSDKRIQELTHINLSLSNLGNCIRALAERGRTHVPYRNSKLTRLLQDSLGGNTRTAFIVTMSPSSDSWDETISTLQFADRAKEVVLRPAINAVQDDASLIASYQAEIVRLRARLRDALAAAAAGGGGGAPADAEASSGAAEADGGESASAAAAIIAQLEAELREARADAARSAASVVRARRAAIAARDETRQLINVAVAASASAHAGTPDGADLDVALKALDAQVKALEARERELDGARADQDERQALLERYYAWLRGVPVTGGGVCCVRMLA